jgi:hypothetical protein
MSGLHTRRIARKGWPGGRLIGLEEVAEVILVGIAIGEWRPGHVVLQVAPDPLKGIQLRALRRQTDQLDVRRQGEPRGRMGPPLSSTRRFRLAGKACAKASRQRLGRATLSLV